MSNQIYSHSTDLCCDWFVFNRAENWHQATDTCIFSGGVGGGINGSYNLGQIKRNN